MNAQRVNPTQDTALSGRLPRLTPMIDNDTAPVSVRFGNFSIQTSLPSTSQDVGTSASAPVRLMVTNGVTVAQTAPDATPSPGERSTGVMQLALRGAIKAA